MRPWGDVTCDAQAHPMGLELVVTVGGEIVRTQVIRNSASQHETSDEWRRAFEDKGWQS